MAGIKLDNNCKFFVKIEVDRYIDETGRTIIKTEWVERDSPISLGSIKNPKAENIYGFKWVSTKKRNSVGFFDDIFKGMGGEE